MRQHLFTSESVTEGHPDKIADQISDAVLDAIYEKDPNGRVACEALVTTGLAFVAGEITTSCYIEIPQIVRETFHSSMIVEHLTLLDPRVAARVQSGGSAYGGIVADPELRKRVKTTCRVLGEESGLTTQIKMFEETVKNLRAATECTGQERASSHRQ